MEYATYKGEHAVFAWIWLISLNITSSYSIHFYFLFANEIISFFYDSNIPLYICYIFFTNLLMDLLIDLVSWLS